MHLNNVRSMLFHGLPFPCDHRWLSKQTNLKSISFDDCYLWKIPSALEHCNQLEHLRVTGLKTSLWGMVAFFPLLKTLTLEFGTIRAYQKVEATCKDLKQIRMSYHELTRVPACIQRLRRLEVLILKRPSLSIPPMVRKIETSETSVVTELDVHIASQLAMLKNLEELDLSDNLLRSLPDCLFELTGLKTQPCL